jgi:Zn finger protein HypA/HybF involved in hydrogenase expression
MKKLNAPITFTCPRCKEIFEFDCVGEYELVLCPVCGTNFMTVRKSQTLLLESFEFNQKTPQVQTVTSILVEL